jgi:hypothetical protein
LLHRTARPSPYARRRPRRAIALLALLVGTSVIVLGTTGHALADVGIGGSLSAPRLVNPISISVGTGTSALRLSDGRDYVIRLPRAKKTGTLEIQGGRNILVVGGYISVAHDGANVIIRDGRNAQAGRVVRLEGLLIDGSRGGHADGIKINAPKAIVQIVMTRIVGLRGSTAGVHADVIQPFGGVRALRIDGMTAASHYNSLYLRRENDPLQPPIGRVTIRHTNIFGYDNVAGWTPSATLRGISIGTQPSDPSDDDAPINCDLTHRMRFRKFFIDPPPGVRLGRFVYPHDGMQRAGCPARVVNGRTVVWPALDRKIDGVVRLGPPPRGDFVPARITGLRYRG